MPLEIHTLEIADLSSLQNQDRIVLAQQWNVTFSAGATTVAPVTVGVTFGTGQLPANYAVLVTPNISCSDYVINKTSSTFSVVLAPFAAATTLAAGTFDAVVIG